jgi:hypothetical protein
LFLFEKEPNGDAVTPNKPGIALKVLGKRIKDACSLRLAKEPAISFVGVVDIDSYAPQAFDVRMALFSTN